MSGDVNGLSESSNAVHHSGSCAPPDRRGGQKDQRGHRASTENYEPKQMTQLVDDQRDHVDEYALIAECKPGPLRTVLFPLKSRPSRRSRGRTGSRTARSQRLVPVVALPKGGRDGRQARLDLLVRSLVGQRSGTTTPNRPQTSSLATSPIMVAMVNYQFSKPSGENTCAMVEPILSIILSCMSLTAPNTAGASSAA
jgi:hypothetical protein